MDLFPATDPATPLARALVVTPVLLDGDDDATRHRAPEARLDEAVRLTRGIGVQVVHAEIVAMPSPAAVSPFGRQGMERLAGLMEAFHADLLVVDHALKPMQQRMLERSCLAKVIDRCGLILEAIAGHATDDDTRMQAELAALQYQRSRLVRCWTHLEDRRAELGFHAMPGGVPGDALLERHRRLLTERIAVLKRDLNKLRRVRDRQRAERHGDGIPTVALVGYAGTGVSTLTDWLRGYPARDGGVTDAVLPSGRAIALAKGIAVLADLPHSVVTAFAVTLDELRDADLILHVQDIADPERAACKAEVNALLTGLGIDPATDPRLIEVLNKADGLRATARAALALRMTDGGTGREVVVSASTGMGLDGLAALIDQRLDALTTTAAVRMDRPALT